MTGNRKYLQTAAAATGNGSPFEVRGYATTVIQITGTFVGTVTFESSLDGANWVAVQAVNLNDGTVGTTATAPGLYRIPTAALADIRARVSAWTSGTITAQARGVKQGAGLSLADVDIGDVEDVIITDIEGFDTVKGQATMAESLPVVVASDQPGLSVVGGGTEAAAQRVTIANDSTGLVSVDDGGGALTVDGTVTANLSVTDNAVLDQIELNTDPLLVVGGGTEATAQRVTIANDSTGLVSVDDGGGSFTVDQATHDNLNANANLQVADADVAAGNPVFTDMRAISGIAPVLLLLDGDRHGQMDVLTIAAGENHIGQVGSTGISIAQIPTVTAGAYAADDNVGGLLTFANAARVSGGGGVIKTVTIVDDAEQDSQLELWLFNQTFTQGADNAAWTAVEADLENVVAIISTTGGEYFSGNGNSVCTIECSLRFDLDATSLFGRLVTRDTPTYAATDDVTVIVGLLQD